MYSIYQTEHKHGKEVFQLSDIIFSGRKIDMLNMLSKSGLFTVENLADTEQYQSHLEYVYVKISTLIMAHFSFPPSTKKTFLLLLSQFFTSSPGSC